MTHGSLFSGIGGFDLAAEWAGWENVFHCEYEPFAQQVLKHHFPNSKLYNDIRTFDATDYFGRIDIITGGFPCQPFSAAGKRKGTEDERHLWPEMLRIIREVAPKYVVGENVRGLLNWSGGMVFEEVCADLEAEGYEVQPYLLPACGKNAPHRRDRIWFIAYANNNRALRRSERNEEASKRKGLQERDKVQLTKKPNSVREFSTDTDSNGLVKERRHDRSGENAKGSNQKIIRSANTENSDGRSSNGIFKGQTNIDRKISKSELHKENKSTDSNGVSKLVKESNVSKRTKQKDRNKIDNSKSLVQKRQDGVQLSEHRRMVSSNENIDTTNGASRKNDIPGVKRMEGNATNTNSERRKRSETRRRSKDKKPFKRPKKLHIISEQRWDDFPTKPPVCGRNDGIPRELDAITFPSWRRKSIAAYGNAIVPQVAYEIFKAINKLEEKNCILATS